jgi:hypothetical protein
MDYYNRLLTNNTAQTSVIHKIKLNTSYEMEYLHSEEHSNIFCNSNKYMDKKPLQKKTPTSFYESIFYQPQN